MMLKPYYLLVLILFVVKTASGQTDVNPLKDTLIYYIKNPDILVDNKDSADYIRVIIPPDKTKEKFYLT